MLARFGGDRELLRDVVAIFEESVIGWRAGLRDAIAARDPARIERVAHAIKGAAGNFTSDGPTPIAAELEATARVGAIDGAPALAMRLERELDRLASTFRTILTER